jgi:hypothetical protein
MKRFFVFSLGEVPAESIGEALFPVWFMDRVPPAGARVG